MLYIPSTMTEFSPYKFKNFQAINVSEDNKKFSSVDGVLFNKDKTKLIFYPWLKSDEEYIIPDSVIEIADRAFGYNDFLKTIIIPESVEYIGDKAFYCNKIQVFMQDNDIKIGTNSFWVYYVPSNPRKLDYSLRDAYNRIDIVLCKDKIQVPISIHIEEGVREKIIDFITDKGKREIIFNDFISGKLTRKSLFTELMSQAALKEAQTERAKSFALYMALAYPENELYAEYVKKNFKSLIWYIYDASKNNTANLKQLEKLGYLTKKNIDDMLNKGPKWKDYKKVRDWLRRYKQKLTKK